MENPEFKLVNHHLKIDLVLLPACAKGLGKYAHTSNLIWFIFILRNWLVDFAFDP